MEVEFEIEKEESGKLKAMNVTAPGGGPVKAPKRDRKRGPRKGGRGGGGGDADGAAAEPAAAATNGKSGGGAAKEKSVREPPFHDVINEEAKAKITGKGVELGRKMTIDVALDQARIKLGQGGYAGLAHGSGMVGEGTYVCDQDGLVQFTWERCLKHADGKWSLGDTSALIQSFSLVNGTSIICCCCYYYSIIIVCWKWTKLDSSLFVFKFIIFLNSNNNKNRRGQASGRGRNCRDTLGSRQG